MLKKGEEEEDEKGEKDGKKNLDHTFEKSIAMQK